MATLREFYDTDFSQLMVVNKVLRIEQGREAMEVPARVHLDFDANAKFVSCFLQDATSNGDACKALVDSLESLLAIGEGVEVKLGFRGEARQSSTALQFAGRLFIYHETEIGGDVQAQLREYAKGRHVFLQFRGPAFAAERTKLERPLAFISHDSRDKDQIARPIAIGLSKLMCPVWFDEFSLKVGDRLRESIERGLKETRKCVLIITPHFLANTGWTKTEFNAVFTREIVERADVVLPVWSDVTSEQVYDYSPSLLDRTAVHWNLGVDEVVRRLHRAIA